MPLTLTLDPQGEQIIAAQLRTGRFHSPEEVVSHALEALAGGEKRDRGTGRSADEAVADIRELRKGVTLGGLKIRDLINEGRK
jgi:Arc/MetJ-type ribon-helix-helix transcriptional regulator